NHAAERTFRYRAEDAIGRHLADLIIPERLRPAHERALRHYVETGMGGVVGQRVEVPGMRADGTEFPVELTVLPVHPEDSPYFTAYLRDITDRKDAERRIAEYSRRLKASLVETVHSVSTTIELRDPYTAGHQRRVAALAVAIGRTLGWPRDRLDGLFLGGLVHDIGKIAVPSRILNERGHLSVEEWETIRSHPEAGFRIVRAVEFPWPIAEMIHQHHERLDGSGYPCGLQGEAILAEARIITVADVVEAIHSARPYRDALGLDAALAEITAGAGTRYDPDIVHACADLLGRGFRIDDNDGIHLRLEDLPFLRDVGQI
ncbi:MAG: HD domain-containing protein, partial [Magnetococcales bacterium]|nr:HD domain-containing protein [Magnetococcales bacterium]